MKLVAQCQCEARIIWLLQGVNVLPGSFMNGQIRWAIIGGIAIVAGAALLVVANRRSGKGKTLLSFFR